MSAQTQNELLCSRMVMRFSKTAHVESLSFVGLVHAQKVEPSNQHYDEGLD